LSEWSLLPSFYPLVNALISRANRISPHNRKKSWTGSRDTYAADVAELTTALDLRNAVHIGHSTGGGEVIRYVARHGKGRVAAAVIISAIPPAFMKSDKNPDGVPKEVIDGLREGTANHRSQFYKDITIPFYGYNREGAAISEGIRENWWRQGMMGGIKAQTDCVDVIAESEFFDDLKMIEW
jgi:non-heme chloroperoxidase